MILEEDRQPAGVGDPFVEVENHAFRTHSTRRHRNHGVGADGAGMSREPGRVLPRGRVHADHHGQPAGVLFHQHLRKLQALLVAQSRPFTGIHGEHQAVRSASHAEIDHAAEAGDVNLSVRAKGRGRNGEHAPEGLFRARGSGHAQSRCRSARHHEKSAPAGARHLILNLTHIASPPHVTFARRRYASPSRFQTVSGSCPRRTGAWPFLSRQTQRRFRERPAAPDTRPSPAARRA